MRSCSRREEKNNTFLTKKKREFEAAIGGWGNGENKLQWIVEWWRDAERKQMESIGLVYIIGGDWMQSSPPPLPRTSIGCFNADYERMRTADWCVCKTQINRFIDERERDRLHQFERRSGQERETNKNTHLTGVWIFNSSNTSLPHHHQQYDYRKCHLNQKWRWKCDNDFVVSDDDDDKLCACDDWNYGRKNLMMPLLYSLFWGKIV
jgi:hypothetical protein